MNISVTGIDKCFGTGVNEVRVLEGLSFDVRDEEFVCIVGPSGCGKSTLLAVMAGLELPDSGTVRFHAGRAATGPVTTIVWQDYALIPWRTIVDNIAFGPEVRGVPKRERYDRARHYLQVMGIEGFAMKYPHQLSGGMRQRAGIARALANDPAVLLMDEPFAAVDAQTRVLLQEELLSVWSKDKKTVVFITHNIEEALLLGDRVLVLSQRPTHVIEEIKVPFPRPRDYTVEADPRFGELKLHIWGRLKDAIVRN